MMTPKKKIALVAFSVFLGAGSVFAGGGREDMDPKTREAHRVERTKEAERRMSELRKELGLKTADDVLARAKKIMKENGIDAKDSKAVLGRIEDLNFAQSQGTQGPASDPQLILTKDLMTTMLAKGGDPKIVNYMLTIFEQFSGTTPDVQKAKEFLLEIVSETSIDFFAKGTENKLSLAEAFGNVLTAMGYDKNSDFYKRFMKECLGIG